jgi:hypothetical protein
MDSYFLWAGVGAVEEDGDDGEPFPTTPRPWRPSVPRPPATGRSGGGWGRPAGRSRCWPASPSAGAAPG